jgi:hypothetical protein
MSEILENIEKRYFPCHSCSGDGKKMLYTQQAGKITTSIEKCYTCKGEGRIQCDHILGEMCPEYEPSTTVYKDTYEKYKDCDDYFQHNYCLKCGAKLTNIEVLKEQSE